jgi:repressor LexA
MRFARAQKRWPCTKKGAFQIGADTVNLDSMQTRGLLTTRQEQVLAYVENRQRETGFAPTLQEAAEHFGLKSPNSIRQHLRLMEKKGFLHRVPGRSRALVVHRASGQDQSDDVVHVPLLGPISAGPPNLAYEDPGPTVALSSRLFHGNQLFALRVRGQSMIGAGILDGDIAILDATNQVEDGTVAAVLIEDEATLKRIFRNAGGLLLRAENPDYRDIEIHRSKSDAVKVIGALIGIVRKV